MTATVTRPRTPARINFDNIPAELKVLTQWCAWRYDPEKGKVPYQVNGVKAKPNTPSTWTTFDNVAQAFGRGGFDGIGFMFSANDPYCGIDLDGCRNPETGVISEWAQPWIDLLSSYVEISPSKAGVKIWVRGTWTYDSGHKRDLPNVERVSAKTPAVEVYDSLRFFTVTGTNLDGQSAILDRQSALLQLRAEYWPEPTVQKRVPRADDFKSDESIKKRARSYIATIPGAVSGQNGSNVTFHVACVLVLGFGLSIDDAYELLEEWNQTCQPPWTPNQLEHKIDGADKRTSDRGYLRNVSPENLDHVQVPDYHEPVRTAETTSPIIAHRGTETTKADPGHIPAGLLKVPGLIGEIIAYNLRTAYLPQPELALAAAIPFAGAIMGRKVEDQMGLRTNVYVVGVAGSGGGKEHGRKISKNLLYGIGLESLTPCEELASSAALLTALQSCPALLLQLDEIGQFLMTAKDPRSAWWRYEIITLCLKLFNQANQIYYGKAHGGKETPKIIQPNLCIYGTSVLQSVLGSMTEENLSDGLLSRLLLIEARNSNPIPSRTAKREDPPRSLIEELEYWRDLNSCGGNLASLSPNPRTLFDGPGVSDLFYEQDVLFRSKITDKDPSSGIWSRATEKARKLALIYQCSMDRESEEIGTEAAQWGLMLVEHLTLRMLFLAGDWISDGKVGGEKLSIIRVIRTLGGKASMSELLSRIRKLKGKEMREHLDDLLSEGVIKLNEIKTAGRTRFEYQIVTDMSGDPSL